MNIFQMIVVPGALAGFIWCAWKSVRGPGRYIRIVNGLLAFIWLSVSILVVFPDFTVLVANFLGIGRGTDLLLYVFIIIAIIYAMYIYYRLCDIRKDITHIVRHIALAERQLPLQDESIKLKESGTPDKHNR